MTEEPLIPQLFKKWSFSRMFSKEERKELKQIEKDAYMEKAREVAKKKGEAKAEEYLHQMKGGIKDKKNGSK